MWILLELHKLYEVWQRRRRYDMLISYHTCIESFARKLIHTCMYLLLFLKRNEMKWNALVRRLLDWLKISQSNGNSIHCNLVCSRIFYSNGIDMNWENEENACSFSFINPFLYKLIPIIDIPSAMRTILSQLQRAANRKQSMVATRTDLIILRKREFNDSMWIHRRALATGISISSTH